METITSKFVESRARLIEQGTLFFETAASAATTFFGTTKKAGERFATDAKLAGVELAQSATAASRTFSSGLSAEARLWLETFERSARVPAIPADLDPAKIPAVALLERQLLCRIEKGLEDVSGLVQGRVAHLDTLVGPQLPASTTGSEAAPSKRSSAAPCVPFNGYDDLSAKDLVSKIERLTDEKASAVLAYESVNKKRATVLRAAELRLSEA